MVLPYNYYLIYILPYIINNTYLIKNLIFKLIFEYLRASYFLYCVIEKVHETEIPPNYNWSKN